MQKEEKIVRGADLATTGQKIKSYVLEQIADKVSSDDIDNVVELTKAQYDALATKDARTMYIISDSAVDSDHVGIAKFEQTTKSTAPGGTNIWTVTLTNNQTFTLAVMNGTQGNSGYSGAAGELEVVNNVTQGGATAALSAEMGKQLEGEISQLGLEVNGLATEITQDDVESTTGSRWTNNNGVVGYASSGTLRRMNAIPIQPGATFTYEVNSGGVDSFIAVLVADENDNILLSSSAFKGTITTPANSAKLYFNYYQSFQCQVLGVRSLVKQEVIPYLAKVQGNSSEIELDATMFETGNIDGATGGPSETANTIRSSNYIRVVGGATLTYHTNGGYRIAIAAYDFNRFIKKQEWFSGDGTFVLPLSANQIKLVIANPSGQSGTPVFDNAGVTISANPGLKSYEAAPLLPKIAVPIYAPSPQLPANSSQDSDFNAETLTPSELNAAFAALLSSLPKPGNYYDNPKFAGVCERVGRDASDTFDIYAYQLGRRNRYAWKAADGLYAWKNGSTIVYTNSISPRIGDTIYSSSAREDSSNTVTAYNSASQQITASNSTTYTQSSSDNVAIDAYWTTETQSIDSPRSLVLFKRDNKPVGASATATDVTHLSYNGKSYQRCEELDYHTDQKMTIVLWGNEHGPQSDPAEPAILIYRMMKDLCGGCRNNAFLSFLKNYCKIVFIPCANPYGLQNHTRNNANNVNVNRNYATPGWASQSDTDKGSYAGDQNETQFIMNTVAYFNADLAIDIHCLGYITLNNVGKVHYEGYIPYAEINDEVKGSMASFSLEYTNYADARPSTNAQGADWIYYIGKAGGLIEMNAGAYAADGGDGNQHTPFIMEADYTLLLQTMRMWMYGVDPTLDLSTISIK